MAISSLANHGDRFPTTRASAIVAGGSPDSRERTHSLELIARVYWKPVYKYLRVKWRKDRDTAADITQSFFATAFDKGTFATYQRGRARFRTFVKACLDRIVAHEHRALRAR